MRYAVLSQYCPKHFQIRKKTLKINSNMCFYIFNIFEPASDKLPKEIQSIGER